MARGPFHRNLPAVAKSLAIENRLPEPTEAKDATVPPLSHLWEDGLPFFRGFVTDPSSACRPAAEALQRIGRFA
jgi:hypothetical protein